MDFRLEIDLKDLISYQLELWHWFLGLNVPIGKKFRNPRRSDKTAGASIKQYGDYIYLLDPSDKVHNCNIFKAIQIDRNCNFKKALQICYYEGLKNKPLIKKILPAKVRKKFQIKSRRRKWNRKDGKFWNIGQISCEQLISEECFPITSFFYLNKFDIYRKVNPTFDVYSNIINGKTKLYGPEKRFFLTDFGKKEIGGLKPFIHYDFIIITKNLKSYLIICNLGYNCRYVPSESSLLPAFFIEILKQFKQVFYLMDNDAAGISYSEKLILQYNGIGLFFPTGTYIDCYGNTKNLNDAYDFTYKYGYPAIKQLLNNLLNQNLLLV